MECKNCGKSHRTEEAVAKCFARSERKAEREAKKKAEIQRRIANAKAVPPDIYIRKLRDEGKNLDQILAGLKKNYLPPEIDSDWDLWEVAYRIAQTVNWPIEDELKTEMILEKHMLSDYVSLHPLEIPGVLSSLAEAGATPIARLFGSRRMELDDGSSTVGA